MASSFKVRESVVYGRSAAPFRFRPGRSGNPGGRPKKDPVSRSQVYFYSANGANFVKGFSCSNGWLKMTGFKSTIPAKEHASQTAAFASQCK
jgi:hypothetical protein